MNNSNPRINDISGNDNNSNSNIIINNASNINNNLNNLSNIKSILSNNNNNNYSNTISTLPQNPTNITNINIISYNNYEENHSQGNSNITLNSNNNMSKKNLGGGNSKKKYTNINQKKEKEKSPNAIMMKKSINKMATSINFNQKNKSNQNFGSFINQNVTNNNNNQSNNTNNILDNAYKTFYKKNKEKDIYNIELDLPNYNPNDSNDNIKNYMQKNKYDVINEEEEFTKEEKIKLKQLASLYKNNNIGYYKKNSPDKNIGNKTKYHSKISPNKNGYYYHGNKAGYNKSGFHLPVIQKGGIYNFIYH